MNCIATSGGLFPLPDDAKSRLSDLKGHQKHDLVSGNESEAIESVYGDVREEYVALQRTAGLDRIVEGQARWDDMLAHPLTVHENVKTGGIVRYYDNNNFYRDPVVEGELTFSGDLAGDLDSTLAHFEDGENAEDSDDSPSTAETGGLQAVVPGPYSLADLATNHYYDGGEFLPAIANFLARELEAFPERVETVFLAEPSLVTNQPGDGEDERASEAIDTVATAIEAEIVVQTYFGALDEKVHAHLLDATIDAVGYDLISNQSDNVYNVSEYGTKDSIALGVVDGQNTLVETPETIRERIDWFDDLVPSDFENAYVTPNTGLFYLPVNRFEDKLASLGAVTNEVPA